MCERCGEISLNLHALGYCIFLEEVNMEEMLKEYHKITGFKSRKEKGMIFDKKLERCTKYRGGKMMHMIKIPRRIRKEFKPDGNLTRLDLRELTINNINLFSVCFQEAILSLSEFESCNLLESSFREASLRDSVIKNSNLRDADFKYTDCFGVSFMNCDLREAQFIKANLIESTFVNCDLTNTVFDESAFAESNSVEASFVNCGLINTVFHKTFIADTEFKNRIGKY